ncbi:MAG: cysteine--tRNA ligase [Xanthobacteraceae bacterium]
MELKLYDTLTREKRLFKPLDPNNVRMYVCGPTVYDFAHIGNARPMIVFDVLFRVLRRLYGADHVTYVRNVTDVDDKINARAAEEYPGLPLNEAIRKVTEKTETQFHEDVAALGCLPPTVEPRATDHIAEMRTLIEKLVASGNAYVAEDNVLFSVPSMKDYGQLSRRPLDEMIAGARVEVAPYKRDPRDFVLWKPSKLSDPELTPLWFWAVEMDPVVRPAEPIEPAWSSPAGIKAPGRPGWHIECSAMSWKYLGEMFDIHVGGIDLVFPHHEDEIAQSRCAFDTPTMANYWMHNGFLQVEGAKMSKSEGNFVTIHELLAEKKFGGREWSGQVFRLAMLHTHYHQPMDWTSRALAEAERGLNRWKLRFFGTDGPLYGFSASEGSGYGDPFGIGDGSGYGGGDASLKTFVEALLDDLNTPLALAILHQIDDPIEFREAVSILGLDFKAFSDWQFFQTKSVDTGRVDQLIHARDAARKARDYKESDRIRDELAKMGVVLKDTKDGTTWEIAR